MDIFSRDASHAKCLRRVELFQGNKSWLSVVNLEILPPGLHIRSTHVPVTPAFFWFHALSFLGWSGWRPYDTAFVPGALPTSAVTAPYFVSCFEGFSHLMPAAMMHFIAEGLFGKLMPLVIQETPMRESSGVPHRVAPSMQRPPSSQFQPTIVNIIRLSLSPRLFWTLVAVNSKLRRHMDVFVLFGVFLGL